MSEFFTPNRILDIAIALITILMVIRYMRSGLIAGVLDFCGTLLAVGGAVFGAKKLAPMLFEKLFRDNLVSRTEVALENAEGVLTINEMMNKISGFLPQNVIETFFGEGTTGTFDLSVPDIAQNVVTDVVQPLVMPVLTILLFFLIFIVCRIVVGFIVTALKNINRIPVLGTVNRALGAASGLLVTEQLPQIVETQASAVRGLTFDKVVVMGGGNDKAGSVGGFVQNLVTGTLPLHELASSVGVELPSYLGKSAEPGSEELK